METKAFRFNVKASDTIRGEFSGYAAVYGNKDRNEEVIELHAMAKSIGLSDGEFPLLWQHQKDLPIGVVRLEETNRGAKAFGRINVDTPMGMQAYNLMMPPNGFKRGALRDMSIGYFVRKDDVRDGIRYLKEIEILEVSLVTIAANPKSQITAVKTADDQNDRITRLELLLKGMTSTLAEQGIIDEQDLLHSFDDLCVKTGNVSDDQANSHSLSELLTEMSLYNIRRELHERDGRTKEGLGRHQDGLGK